MPAATHGVLFINLKSGGGKAERFRLVDECTRRGIQPVVLEPGQDWLEVVREVAASGVDVLGMAGGDGSPAMVSTVAVEIWGCRWWWCQRARGTILRLTSDSTVTTSSARSMVSEKPSSGRWTSPTSTARSS